MRKRDELRSKELMDAFTNSERSFEEVMRFLAGKEETDNYIHYTYDYPYKIHTDARL